jgi:hypothetical protein
MSDQWKMKWKEEFVSCSRHSPWDIGNDYSGHSVKPADILTQDLQNTRQIQYSTNSAAILCISFQTIISFERYVFHFIAVYIAAFSQWGCIAIQWQWKMSLKACASKRSSDESNTAASKCKDWVQVRTNLVRKVGWNLNTRSPKTKQIWWKFESKILYLFSDEQILCIW